MVFAGASRRGYCEKLSTFDSLGKASLCLSIWGFADAYPESAVTMRQNTHHSIQYGMD
jgi:hypothetical protein